MEERPYAKGGLIVGPDGSDSVPWFPMEREAIVDRHGRVMCRYVGGRFVPEVEVRVEVDVEGFRRRLIESIIAASGRGYPSGEGIDWTTVRAQSGEPFVWSAVPVDEDEGGDQ